MASSYQRMLKVELIEQEGRLAPSNDAGYHPPDLSQPVVQR